MNTQRLRVLCALIFLMGLPGLAAAQTNTEIFQQFQWNFSTPGARPNAMGRAFIGLADDATATVTNPAGLLSLTRPQVYVEFKNTNLRVPRLAAQDAILTGQTTDFGENVSALSFISVAAPIGKSLAVSFARHEFLNYKENFVYPPRLETDTASFGAAFFPVAASSDFNGASYAGTIAAAVGKQLRVGLTVAIDQLSATSDLLRTGCIPASCSGSGARSSGVKQNDAIIAKQNSTSNSLTVGALYKPTQTVAAGFVYIKAPSFTLNEDFVGFDFGGAPHSLCQSGFLSPCSDPLFPQDITLHVPRRFGGGLSARPNNRVLVSFDVMRVLHSDLMKDFVVTTSFTTLKPANFTVRDVTEVHAGGEYNVVGGSKPVFIRAGVFTNPDHHLRFVPTDNLTTHQKSSSNDQFNLFPEETKIFGTFGGGFVVGSHFQMDFAYVGSRSKEVVVSAAMRF